MPKVNAAKRPNPVPPDGTEVVWPPIVGMVVERRFPDGKPYYRAKVIAIDEFYIGDDVAILRRTSVRHRGESDEYAEPIYEGVMKDEIIGYTYVTEPSMPDWRWWEPHRAVQFANRCGGR
jgi:hypothetical protein